MSGSKRIKRLRTQAKAETQTHKHVSDKVLGYCRVSTDEQAANGYSLAAQREALTAFARSQGSDLVRIIADEAVSGGTRPEERKGFKEVLKLAEDGAFSVLLVWKFDRLSRSLLDSVVTVNSLRVKHGIVLRSVTEPIDTSTSMGEMIFALLAGFAAEERNAITRRTLIGKRQKATEGGFAGGSAPYGYQRDREGGLEVCEAEAQVVRRIFKMRKRKQTLQEIADALNTENVPTRRGGKWWPGTVRYILDNPKYRGFVEYLFQWEGREAHVLKPGTHEAIIIPKVRRAAA